jgi:hypothetical protein
MNFAGDGKKKRRSRIPRSRDGITLVIDELERRGFDAKLGNGFRTNNNVLLVKGGSTLQSVSVRTVHFSPWYVASSIFAGAVDDQVSVYVLLGIEKSASPRFFLAKNSELQPIFRQPKTWVTFGFIDVEAMEKYENNWGVLRA